MMIICIKKWWIDDLSGYGWPIIMGGVAIIFFSWLFNYQNRSIEFLEQKILIRNWLDWRWKEIPLEEVVGYQLKQTYTRYGLDYHIQIITQDNEYEFIKDVYSDYSRIGKLLKLHQIKYLGRKPIESKYKNLYATVTIWGAIISALLFGLVQLMKLIK